MISRWASLKGKALDLRRRGASIVDIEKNLGIPRSTLSDWIRTIVLTPKQLQFLGKRRQQALVKARHEAVKWHNAQKAKRLAESIQAGKKTLGKIKDDLKMILQF